MTTKPAYYRSVGYAYPTSNIAKRCGAYETGCWYFCLYTAEAAEIGDPFGPYDSCQAALRAGIAEYPHLKWCWEAIDSRQSEIQRNWIAYHSGAAAERAALE